MRPEVGAAVPEVLPLCLWWWSRRRASEGWCGEEKETQSARVGNGELRVGGGRRREVGRKDCLRLKQKLICGVHMSASGGKEKLQGYFGPYVRCLCIQWSDSGPRHLKSVKNDMDRVDEKLQW